MARHSKAQIGEIRPRIHNGRTTYWEATDKGWKYVPTGKPRFGNGTAEVEEKRQNTRQMKKTPVPEKREARIASKVPIRRFVANTDRPPIEKTTIVRTDRNPESFTVKKETGKLVPVTGYPVKTWKYRKQHAA